MGDDRFVTEVQTLARKLADGPTRAHALTRRALRASADNDFDAQLDLEAELQRAAGAGPDFREGVAAFLAKRPARFTGA